MSFDTYFRASSYAMIACGALALAVAGGMSAGLFGAFLLLLVAAWTLEGRKWQLSERAGLVVVVAALPLFYLHWRSQGGGAGLSGGGREYAALGALVQFTLFLSAVKLLQKKADRDWLFLYVISFFEVLLAAGLSLSPVFVGTLGLYVFAASLTVVCFELKKARRSAPNGRVQLAADDGRAGRRAAPDVAGVLRRLPLAALLLLALIFALALPIFFVAPRFGGSAMTFAGGGATGYVGFSERVTLGEIGRLQQSNRLVMRVRVEDQDAAAHRQNLRWRGVALDQFTGRAWSRTPGGAEAVPARERNFYPLGTTEHLSRLTAQTFFLEPIDTPVLFAAPRAVAVQGALPFVRRDREGALTTAMHPQERLSYRAFSDTVEPDAAVLRADDAPYAPDKQRYLELPRDLDTGVASLAWLVADRAGARTRYDKARAIESYLNTEFGYTLDMKATGPDPLADFLFRVREGHCEYFSTAMAVMLRTQGVATRVVNGFQTGEYNESADAYIVRQSHAHSWVEVYFPETDSWVTFDPTPPSGRASTVAPAGLHARLREYADALELFWIQYVVAYDRQEQRSLANSITRRWRDYRRAGLAALSSLGSWWRSPSRAGGPGALPSFAGPLLVGGALSVTLFLFLRRSRGFAFGRRAAVRGAVQETDVSFYRRLVAALEARGQRRDAHQTPLEFAAATGLPEAVSVTRAYHRVRYGARPLTPDELAEVEENLKKVEGRQVPGAG